MISLPDKINALAELEFSFSLLNNVYNKIAHLLNFSSRKQASQILYALLLAFTNEHEKVVNETRDSNKFLLGMFGSSIHRLKIRVVHAMN